MSNPLSMFRKHQTVLLAVFGVGLILIFTIGPSLQLFYSNPDQGVENGVVVQIGDTELRESDVQAMKFNRELIRLFMSRINGVAAQNGGEFKRHLGGIPNTRDERSLVRTRMLAKKAGEMGLVIGDDAVIRFLEDYTDGTLKKGDFARELGNVSGGRMSQRQFFDAMRVELLAFRFAELFQKGLVPATPLKTWDYYQRLHRQIEVEAVPFPVANHIDHDATFNEKVIEEAYEAGKDLYSFPSSPEPGYKRRKKIEVQYVVADLEPYLNEEREKITQDQIAEYYEKNKEQFRKLSLPGEDDFGAGDPSDPVITEGGDIEAADSEAADSEAADSEAGDSEAADSEAGDSEAADSEAADSEAGDSEAGDSEAGDSEAGDSEAGDSEAGDSEAGDSEAADSEAADSEAADSEAAGSEAADSEAADSEGGDIEAADSEAADSEAADSEAADSEAGDSEAADSEAADSEAADSEAADSEAADSEAAGSEAADSEAADSEAADSEAADSEAADSEAADSEAADSEAADSEAAGSEAADSEAADSEAGNTEADQDGAGGQDSAAAGRQLTFNVALLQDQETQDDATSAQDDLDASPPSDGDEADLDANQPAGDDSQAGEAADTESNEADATPEGENPAAADPADDLSNLPEDVGGGNSTSPEAEAKPEYSPLEEVADDIRTQLAREPATSRMQSALSEIRDKMKEYHSDYHWSRENKGDSQENSETLDLDLLQSLAAPHGLKAEQIPLVDVIGIQDTDPVTGEAQYAISRAYDKNGARFVDLAFDGDLRLCDPKSISGHVRDMEYIYWKVAEDIPDEPPTLEECRDEIIADLKMKAALPKAKKAANEAAKQLERNNQSPADAYRNSVDRKVLETGPFSWMTPGFSAPGFNVPPRLSQIPGIRFAGNDFMRDVFRLKQGQTGVATDNPHETVYVVYVKKEASDDAQLRNLFYRTGVTGEIAQVMRQDAERALGEWLLDYEKRQKVKWIQEPATE